ncbi:MAG: (Fe-S)-binding protein [Peptococcaceae bacterium BRH_c8a]|nr:MAG: (Fe-S)-binding protein [Peptococcaceae bacterium BRH_c8a]
MNRRGDIKRDIKEALGNKNLRGALTRFGEAYLESRARAYAGKDFNALREEICAIKRNAADKMEDLAQRFTRAAEARGTKVFRAATAQEAREYIANLARQKNVRQIVKSKSMASEEIHLNEHLHQLGLETVETDLGEWILQLSGQKPSHMVMPAIHMTRGEVAQVFSKEVREQLPPDIPKLVKVARQNLRRKFLEAQMGITGANIAVAETGTIVIVTNEGNGRLTTTLPPLHVAVVGLEKLVEKFSDIKPILEALPRSATAQKITSYVSMITGPTPVAYPDGTTGDKELHIVLLDNGRTQMQADPVFKEALQCIRCASCLNVCPVFQIVGGHVYGYVYTGGIGTVLTAFLNGWQNASEIQNLCLGCERCKLYCPGKIDLPRLIRELRRRTGEKAGAPSISSQVMAKVLPNRRLFHSLLRAAGIAQKPFQRGGMVRHLPLFLAGLTEGRSLPAIVSKPLRDRVAQTPKTSQIVGDNQRQGVRVGFFAGCLVDFVYPRIGEAVKELLTSAGIEMVFPMEQTCCGVPALYTGLAHTAAEAARQNITAFEHAGVDRIVTACPTCAQAIKRYPEILAGEPEWHQRATTMANQVEHVTGYLHGVFQRLAGARLKKARGTTVTYHDSCHMKGCLGLTLEPRELLGLAGYNLVELECSDRCCGFGGSYSIKFPQLSRQILDNKLDTVAGAEVGTLALDCPGCLLQISGGLTSRGSAVTVKHTVELLDL